MSLGDLENMTGYLLKITGLWNVTSFFHPEDGGSISLRMIGKISTIMFIVTIVRIYMPMFITVTITTTVMPEVYTTMKFYHYPKD